MNWFTLFALTLGGVLLAVALRLANPPERTVRTGARRAPDRSRRTWSSALRGARTCICQYCGTLNLLPASQLTRDGATVRCASCHRTAHVPPPVPHRDDGVSRDAARLRSS